MLLLTKMTANATARWPKLVLLGLIILDALVRVDR